MTEKKVIRNDSFGKSISYNNTNIEDLPPPPQFTTFTGIQTVSPSDITPSMLDTDSNNNSKNDDKE